MDEERRELLRENCWALLDVEFIRISSTHRCVRKLYVLADNGYTQMEMEFYPCKRYRDLEKKYKKSFQYCRRNIHNLSFHPWKFSPLCSHAASKLNDFIVHNAIELILYKGGTVERDLSEVLDIPSFNIESIEGLKKAYSHDPQTEVNFYFSQIVEMLKQNEHN